MCFFRLLCCFIWLLFNCASDSCLIEPRNSIFFRIAQLIRLCVVRFSLTAAAAAVFGQPNTFIRPQPGPNWLFSTTKLVASFLLHAALHLQFCTVFAHVDFQLTLTFTYSENIVIWLRPFSAIVFGSIFACVIYLVEIFRTKKPTIICLVFGGSRSMSLTTYTSTCIIRNTKYAIHTQTRGAWEWSDEANLHMLHFYTGQRPTST